MQITDAIGDMLTRIRNASSVKHETVSVPASNMKKEIARILQDEGYISSYKVIEDNKQGLIEIKLKYNQDRTPAIMGIKRVSKPGLRIYADVDNLPRVIRGMGIAILSTSKGVMTDKEARRSNVGGEVIAYVW